MQQRARNRSIQSFHDTANEVMELRIQDLKENFMAGETLLEMIKNEIFTCLISLCDQIHLHWMNNIDLIVQKDPLLKTRDKNNQDSCVM